MRKEQVKIGEPNGVMSAAASFKKLSQQRPSKDLMDAFKRIKDRETLQSSKVTNPENNSNI